MTFFPEPPKEDPVSEDQALPAGTPVVLQPGEVGGVSVNVTVDLKTGSVITTVRDAEGNILPVADLACFVLDGTANVTIFLENAPAGTATVSVEKVSAVLEASGKDSKTIDDILDLLDEFGDQSNQLLSISSFALGDSSAQTGFITYTETYKTSGANLSQGNDAHVTTTLGNVVYGNNGDDLFIITQSGTRNAASKAGRTSFIDMGEGEDTLAITKGALRENNSKVVLRDFSSKNDQLAVDATKKQVQGIGTNKLTISTRKSRFVVTTETGKFKKNDIEFT